MSLADLFARIDAVAAGEQAHTPQASTASSGDSIPLRLLHLGSEGESALLADSAAGAGRSACALPCVSTAVPLPSGPLLASAAVLSAFQSYLSLDAVLGGMARGGSSLYARQEVWDDPEVGGAASLVRGPRVFELPVAPAQHTMQLQSAGQHGMDGSFEERRVAGTAWWRGNISSISSAALGGASGSSSSSVLRPLASRALFATGAATFVPFRPGGLEDDAAAQSDSVSSSGVAAVDGAAAIRASVAQSTLQSLFPFDYPAASGVAVPLHSAPPGFSRGLRDSGVEADAAEQSDALAAAHEAAEHQALATQKARDAALSSTQHSAGMKIPAENPDRDAGASSSIYIAGVNPASMLSSITSGFTEELQSEYRTHVRDTHHIQSLRRTEKIRAVSEEVDESLFADEDEAEHALRLQQRAREQLEGLPALDLDEDLLAELDLTLPSAAALKLETDAAQKVRLATARNLWATAERLDTSNFHAQLPNLAIRYPFELDPFQKEAILHLERGESVFVAAHTSAGKTVVAEYAIALSAKHLTRAVYTSPIKTLSNQKFREFRSTFGEKDVGIITGDVSINPEASCLILTTEILRSMLYKGADLIRDIEWVIFDEVHYINDLERGVVWEEVIIMLPAHVNFVLLSATVPNTLEFADWVGRTKKKNIFVISTDKRPVPLQHFLWCRQKLYQIMDGATGRFLPEGFKAAKTEGLTDKTKALQKRGIFKKPSLKQAKSSWVVLISYLQKQELLPVVIFAFSKKVCEDCAYGMYNMDLTSSAEKSEVTTLVSNSLNRLQVSDRKLPQVLRVRELARRGIGLHHAGMLPILKEIIELLFSRGLIKVLFATETFAMGVNMPTKTVVFYALRKHDGQEFRELRPGEYTQMSGRAGRRGLDKFGIVIINSKNDEPPDELSVKQMLMGKATKLESRFRLTYNMILNLLRQEDMKVEEMIKRSFGELITARDTPMRKQLLAKGEAKLKHQRPVVCTAANPCSAEAMSEFFHLSSSIDRMQCHLFESLFHPGSPHSTKYLAVGRVMMLKIRGLENCAAVVLRNQPPATLASASASSSSSSSSASSLAKAAYVAFVLVPPIQFVSEKYVASAAKLGLTLGSTSSASPAAFNGKLSWLISEFNASNVIALLNEKLEVDVAGVLVDKFARKIDALAVDLLTKVQEKHGVPIPAPVWNQAVAEGLASPLPAPGPAVGKLKPLQPSPPKVLVVNRLPPALLLDPLQDLKLNAAASSVSATGEERDNFQLLDEQYLKVQFQRQLEASPVAACPQAGQHSIELGRQALLVSKVASLRSLLSNQNLDLISDFETRMRILQHLRYVDPVDRTVQLKGRVACEINTCDSLIVTELIFENVLTRLEPEEIVSLLSCLIFQEKNSDDPVLSDRLLAAHAALSRITLSLGQLQLQLGLDIVPEDFVSSSLNWGMMQVVWDWARDKKFVEICAVTNVLEGSIVRCITRLDETCRDVRNAARVIGDAPLYAKMIRASELIKRDIVFAASLYVS